METYQREIVGLLEKVTDALGYERATVFARDCLLQWDTGGEVWLMCTLEAWERYLDEVKNNGCHTDENRHGAWVPAITLHK